MAVNRIVTLEQQRGSDAWNAIIGLADHPQRGEKRTYNEQAQEYAREARKLPIRIISSGLGQALAFIESKSRDSKPGLRKLSVDLSKWVLSRIPSHSGEPSLLKNIIFGDAIFLRRATDETLAYLKWLNRFAEAEGLAAEDDFAEDHAAGA